MATTHARGPRGVDRALPVGLRGLMSEDIAERRFRWLLQQRRYCYWPEAELGKVITLRRTRPDFFVRTPADGEMLVEVESFAKPTVLKTMVARVFSLDAMSLQKRINRVVCKAADQLEPYSVMHIPLVVALDNWRQVGLSLGPSDLIQIFGLVEVTGMFDPSTGESGKFRWALGDDSPLGEGRRTHVSAVAAVFPESRDIDDDFSTERPMYTRVVHNPFAAVPLPRSVFGSEKDKHIVREGGVWKEIVGGPRGK